MFRRRFLLFCMLSSSGPTQLNQHSCCSKDTCARAEWRLGCRAELQAQMQQAQEAKRKLKQEELAQDKRMLDALRSSPPNRHINIHGGGSSPPPPGVTTQNTGASMSAVMGGAGGHPTMTAHPPAMAALADPGAAYGMYRDTGEGRQMGHNSLQENESAAGNRFVSAVASGCPCLFTSWQKQSAKEVWLH